MVDSNKDCLFCNEIFQNEHLTTQRHMAEKVDMLHRRYYIIVLFSFLGSMIGGVGGDYLKSAVPQVVYLQPLDLMLKVLG